MTSLSREALHRITVRENKLYLPSTLVIPHQRTESLSAYSSIGRLTNAVPREEQAKRQSLNNSITYLSKTFLCHHRASSETGGPSEGWPLFRPPYRAREDEGEGGRSNSRPPTNSERSGQLLQPAGADADYRWARQHRVHHHCRRVFCRRSGTAWADCPIRYH